MWERKNHSFLDFFSQNSQNLFLWKSLCLDQFRAATVSHLFHSLLACNSCKLLVPSFQPIPCLHTWILQLLKVLFIDFSKNGHISKYLQVIWILHASFLQIQHHFHFGHFGHAVRCSHLSHVQVAWISSFRICCCCVCLQSQELVLLEQLSQLTTSLLAIISKVINSLFVACYGMNMSVVCGLLSNEHNAFAN
jgi:hypothetical protein